MRFEKCNCGKTAGGPHGYFYVEGRGKYPVIPIFSKEAGEVALNSLADELGLSCAKKAEVRGQLRAAGLAEKVTEADLAVAELAELEAALKLALLFAGFTG
jgi:hypothetical protein